VKRRAPAMPKSHSRTSDPRPNQRLRDHRLLASLKKGRLKFLYFYDLFDFDLDVRTLGLPVGAFVPSLARAGAKFQGAHLGKGTSRPGGLVFQNVYVFGSRTFPGFTLIQLTER